MQLARASLEDHGIDAAQPAHQVLLVHLHRSHVQVGMACTERTMLPDILANFR